MDFKKVSMTASEAADLISYLSRRIEKTKAEINGAPLLMIMDEEHEEIKQDESLISRLDTAFWHPNGELKN